MNSLPLSVELKGVSSLPCFVSRTTDGLGESVTLSEASGLLAGTGEALELSVLVDWLGDPLHVWVSSDDLVDWVNHHYLVVLVGGVLSGPVAVDDSETAHSLTGSLLGDRLDSSLELELVDSLVHWLTVGGTLWREALSASSSHSHSVDNVAFLKWFSNRERRAWHRCPRCWPS